MPIYVYACDAGHYFEEVRQVKDKDDVTTCQGDPEDLLACGLVLRRVPTKPSLRFVGSGFTPTHYPGRENKNK